ncbi:MAG: ABC transporter ATP-binding protein [Ardenticatenia bacterium]|nr:ABC transporter ATP-binding protein [Ardenticatenia bacterium]
MASASLADDERPLLEVRGLSKHFAGLSALSDVSFTVAEGEFVGLIGPNGAGKTTCFNVLTGFLRPTRGSVRFRGVEITGLKPHQITRLGIARTFQLVRPFGRLSVLENVMVPALIAEQAGRLNARSPRHVAFDVLEMVGLAHRAHEPAANLPHGELKRLELARALATRPSLLLLDEPFGGLSYDEAKALEHLIRRLFERGELTVILVEHVLRVLMNLSQRVLVLDYGRLIASGTPDEVSRNPAVIEAYLGAAYSHMTTQQEELSTGGNR